MKKHTILKILLNAFFVILALIILLPMAWMILNSQRFTCSAGCTSVQELGKCMESGTL